MTKGIIWNWRMFCRRQK